MSWSEERVEVLKKMWLEGKSASEIAKELGDITRNAVIGKVHRLGLSNREIKPLKGESDSTELKKVRKRGRPRKNQTVLDGQKSLKDTKRGKLNLSLGITNKKTEKKETSKENFETTEVDSMGVVSDLSEETLKSLIDIESKSKKISLMDLTERTCKWPIGDPATEKFWFCGHDSEAGKPYCKTHISIAFQQVTQRRSKKDS